MYCTKRRLVIIKIFPAPILSTATVAGVSVVTDADVAAVFIAVDFLPQLQKITVTTRRSAAIFP